MKSKIKIIDISRPLSRREPVYPGNQGVRLDFLKTFKASGSTLSAISMGIHSGTHVDAPLHNVRHGKSVDQLPLDLFIGWARVVEVATDYRLPTHIQIDRNEIDAAYIKKIKPQKGEIMLFKTKNSLPRKKFDPTFAHISEGAARELVKAKIKAVGIDGPSIRRFRLRPDTVHPLLLKNNIMIFEGLHLHKVKPGRYYFIGLPLKIMGAEGSPVRAVLIK